MMRINVSSNAAEVSGALRLLFLRQAPFATSLAINMTVKGLQHEQREGMRKRFNIRRSYVLQGVKISKFSTKQDLTAHIEIDPKRNFLFKFEDGGVTKPRGSRFAIPSEARRTKAGVVSKAQRPKALGFKLHGKGPKAEVHRGKRRTVMIRKPDGSGGIFQRLGPRGRPRRKRGQKRIGKFRLLFSFSPRARIEPTLEFEITARRVMQENFARNFEFAFNKAVRTSR
jgi:hypothetical protein